MYERVCNALIVASIAGVLFIGCSIPALAETEEPEVSNFKSPRFPQVAAPDPSLAFELKANRETAKEIVDNVLDIKCDMTTVTLPTKTMVLTSLGTYYITGYTSLECGGSTTTASGATCHKGNPTTCAIDPKLHDFGDLFYIEEFDQVYVAEDTGSAVKGKHLDLYFWDDEYNYALSITGYYEVYAVEYVYGEVSAMNYDIQSLVAQEGALEWKLSQ
jgi:3D (Asp-Asp-Asp) domain-containing protein